MTRAAKNTTFKNQLRNFLYDEIHLYGIILAHLTSNVVLKTRKRLLAVGYRILKFRLTHSLPDHNCKPRAQMKQHTVTSILRRKLHHNNKLTSLLGFRRVCALSFLLSSIRLFQCLLSSNKTISRILVKPGSRRLRGKTGNREPGDHVP